MDRDSARDRPGEDPDGPDLGRALELAHELADGAREILRRRFRDRGGYQLKADATPVTEADREVERHLRARLAEACPEHGVLGEEEGAVGDPTGWRWVLDPIDGTKNFATGNPLFGTLIALALGDDPRLGVIECPATGERWSARRGGGTWYRAGDGEARRVRVREPRPLDEAVLYTTSPDLYRGAEARGFAALREAVRFAQYGGDCYAYGLLARGDVDLVLDPGLQPWDLAALVPVVEEAGGVALDLEGRRPGLSAPTTAVLATDRDLALRAVEFLSGG